MRFHSLLGRTGRHVLLVALSLTVVLGLAACAEDDDAADEPDDDVEAEEGEEISLTVGAGHEAGGALTYTNWMEDFLVPELEERIEEETPHSVSITEAYAGAIAGVDEVLDAVDDGLLDIGGICYCFEPSDLFLHNVDFFVPFSSPDPELAMEAYRDVFEEVPYMTEVLEDEHNQKLLALYGTSSYELQTQFPVESMHDFDGRSISAAGPNLPWVPEDEVDVAGVQGALPDWYTGLQTGVYEGVIMYPEGTWGFSLHEVAEHTTLIGFGASPQGGIHINLDTWASLPGDVQDIVVEVGEEYEATIGERIAIEREDRLDTMEEEGATIAELSEDARAEWAQALHEYPLEQIEEAEDRGLDVAREVFEAYIAAQEERGYEFPRDWALE